MSINAESMLRAAAGFAQPPDHESRLMIFMNHRCASGRPAALGTMPAVTTPPPLFPDAAPCLWRLPVSGGHELQCYEWGNPQGQPALLLHGGPGSGLSPWLARCLDPAHYRIIGFDQRGCGRSTPAGGTAHNLSNELLADLRALRRHLGLDSGRAAQPWLVVGGSWGATLALLHAADQPQAVAGLLLRGVFVARAEDVDAFLHADAGTAGQALQPWRDQARAQGLPLVAVLNQVVQHGPAAQRDALLQAWWRFELAMDGAAPTPQPTPRPGSAATAAPYTAPSAAPDAAHTAAPAPQALLARYQVHAHYLAQGFGLVDRPLLARLADVPAVPTLLLQGALDRTCPWPGAQAVALGLPWAQLRRVEAAGHAPTHPAMAAALVRAAHAFACWGRFDAPAEAGASAGAGADPGADPSATPSANANPNANPNAAAAAAAAAEAEAEAEAGSFAGAAADPAGACGPSAPPAR